MFKTLTGFTQFSYAANVGLNLQQTRNTFVLKRRFAPRLHKKGYAPQKLKSSDFIYDLVVNKNVLPHPPISVILTQYAKGLGNRGDILEMRPQFAYERFLLPGLAVYNTPKNAVKYPKAKVGEIDQFSSPHVEKLITILQTFVLNVTMSKIQPWVMEPWHIRAAFRMQGCHVPEHAIGMPSAEIRGPDLSLQNKEFFVTVTLNGVEKVNVVCRVNQWANELENIPLPELPAYEPLFAEQAETLSKIQANRLAESS